MAMQGMKMWECWLPRKLLSARCLVRVSYGLGRFGGDGVPKTLMYLGRIILHE